MVFDYDDKSDVMNLEDFKSNLIEDLFLSVFFQQKTERVYNMLKLPIIMAPCVLRTQVNNDIFKKTIMEKEFFYEEETLDIFMKMIETKQIKINSISDLSSAQLRKFSTELGIYDSKKSAELMRSDLLNLSKILLAGQVFEYY